MRHNRIEIYIHFIWSTWDRAPLIETRFERALYRCIECEAQGFNCRVLAVNGVENHVHTLLQFPATVTIAEVVQAMKGKSSLLVNEQFAPATKFRWSSAYAAFSVSCWNKKSLIAYIENQKQHHADASWKEALELRPDEADLIQDIA